MDTAEIIVFAAVGFCVLTVMPFVTGYLERWADPPVPSPRQASPTRPTT